MESKEKELRQSSAPTELPTKHGFIHFDPPQESADEGAEVGDAGSKASGTRSGGFSKIVSAPAAPSGTRSGGFSKLVAAPAAPAGTQKFIKEQSTISSTLSSITEPVTGEEGEEAETGVGSSLLPSVGSEGHPDNCRPCAWMYRRDTPGGCSKGDSCTFCHLCGLGELKRRKRLKAAEGSQKLKEAKAKAEKEKAEKGEKKGEKGNQPKDKKIKKEKKFAQMNSETSEVTSSYTSSTSGFSSEPSYICSPKGSIIGNTESARSSLKQIGKLQAVSTGALRVAPPGLGSGKQRQGSRGSVLPGKVGSTNHPKSQELFNPSYINTNSLRTSPIQTPDSSEGLGMYDANEIQTPEGSESLKVYSLSSGYVQNSTFNKSETSASNAPPGLEDASLPFGRQPTYISTPEGSIHLPVGALAFHQGGNVVVVQGDINSPLTEGSSPLTPAFATPLGGRSQDTQTGDSITHPAPQAAPQAATSSAEIQDLKDFMKTMLGGMAAEFKEQFACIEARQEETNKQFSNQLQALEARVDALAASSGNNKPRA